MCLCVFVVAVGGRVAVGDGPGEGLERAPDAGADGHAGCAGTSMSRQAKLSLKNPLFYLLHIYNVWMLFVLQWCVYKYM